MTLVMAYVILITAGIGACAAVFESVLRPRQASLRWSWVLALCVAPLATAFAFFVPRSADEVPVPREVLVTGTLGEVPLVTSLTSVTPGTAVAANVMRLADAALPLAWLGLSVVLLVALAVGQWRFRTERRNARQARIADHDVLVTRSLGPAVAGVWKPVVFVPEWVTALDDVSVRLLLAHEREHVKERDTSVLLFGAVSAALQPWNPVVWWMVRRLRQAVEQDCDARVLAKYPGVRRYADLLLTAASRHGLGARLLAAHFGEEATDLMRRIEAMTSRNRIPWARVAGTSMVAAVLVAAACETPRPDPVAPIAKPAAVLEQEVPSERSAEFTKQLERCTPSGGDGCNISVIVRDSELRELARYEGEIPVADLSKDAISKINVENAACGPESCSLVWITLKPGGTFSKMRKTLLSVDTTLQMMDSVAGQVRRLLTSKMLGDSTVERQRDSVLSRLSRFPRVILRDSSLRDSSLRELPAMLIQSSTGNVLRSFTAGPLSSRKLSLDEINQDDIGAIEVYKGKSCPSVGAAGCPLIRITLKPGREGSYIRR